MLDVRNLSHAFDEQPVLRDVDLHVDEGEIVCLLGASGSGKTTLLRLIAGLEHVQHGRLTLHDKPFDQVPVHERDFGLVFQDFALFPHMTVAENIQFGVKMRGFSTQEKQKRTRQMLELVGLEGFDARSVGQLSGGERQRVALARSLATQPRLLMLDEPLGSLDAVLRDRLVVDLQKIVKSLGLTAVYVTHDQQEAFAVADRIAVMHAGQIAQIDTPHTLYFEPRTVYVARFLGLDNIVSAAVLGGDIAGENILLHPDGLLLDGAGRIKGTITERVFQGAAYRLTVQLDGDGATVKLNTPSQGERRPQVGDEVRLSVAEWAIQPLEG